MKTEIEKLDLVALTSERGDSCYREINGEKMYDFKRVIITVTNSDGSRKRYEIFRGSCGEQKYKNHIETHTIPADGIWYDKSRYNKHKFYDDSNFDAKLTKLAREIAKTNYEIRVLH